MKSIIIYILLAVFFVSCTTLHSTFVSPDISIKTIHIKTFKSYDPLISEQVKMIVKGCYIEKTQLEIVDGEADIIIDGIITTASGYSSSSSLGGAEGVVLGKSSAIGSNRYVSDITVKAVYKGKTVAVANAANRQGGSLSAGILARQAAERLRRIMVKNQYNFGPRR